MLPVARLGDIGVGVCTGHESPRSLAGIVQSSAVTHIIQGSTVSVLADLVVGGDGHVGKIVTVSVTNMSEGRGKARMTSSFVGTFSGIIVSGCYTHLSG